MAVSVLYVQRCNVKKAKETLDKLKNEELHALLLEHWELVFDSTACTNKTKGASTFSELAVILMGSHPELLSKLFVVLIFDKRCLDLHKILKVRFICFNQPNIQKK